MAYVKKRMQVGEWGYTTRVLECDIGYFEKDTWVQVVGYDELTGYDLEDEYGNIIHECEIDSVKPYNDNQIIDD